MNIVKRRRRCWVATCDDWKWGETDYCFEHQGYVREGEGMNEYSRIRNEHDRAVILAQLVNADARAWQAAAVVGDGIYDTSENYRQSRAELWKLIGPAPEASRSMRLLSMQERAVRLRPRRSKQTKAVLDAAAD